MSFSTRFARGVALIGGAAIRIRRLTEGLPEPAWGSAPAIPKAKPQGSIPTLKMPIAKGWEAGQTPIAAPGLEVNAFAGDLDHPRWIEGLPNGDVLIAEATSLDRVTRLGLGLRHDQHNAARRGHGGKRQPYTLLRDKDGDGVAETREVFLDNQSQPFGMALVGDTFYVGNTDGVVAFPYTAGASRITAPGRKLVTFKPAGHWTRSLSPSPDRRKLYAGVGSLTDIADQGMRWRKAVPTGAAVSSPPACATR